MTEPVATVILLIVMIGLIVGLDVAFLRNNMPLRLITNVAIVLIGGLIYVMFIRG